MENQIQTSVPKRKISTLRMNPVARFRYDGFNWILISGGPKSGSTSKALPAIVPKSRAEQEKEIEQVIDGVSTQSLAFLSTNVMNKVNQVCGDYLEKELKQYLGEEKYTAIATGQTVSLENLQNSQLVEADRIITDKVKWFSLQDQLKQEEAKKSRKRGVKAKESVAAVEKPVSDSKTGCVKIKAKRTTPNKRGTMKKTQKCTKQNNFPSEEKPPRKYPPNRKSHMDKLICQRIKPLSEEYALVEETKAAVASITQKDQNNSIFSQHQQNDSNSDGNENIDVTFNTEKIPVQCESNFSLHFEEPTVLKPFNETNKTYVNKHKFKTIKIDNVPVNVLQNVRIDKEMFNSSGNRQSNSNHSISLLKPKSCTITSGEAQEGEKDASSTAKPLLRVPKVNIQGRVNASTSTITSSEAEQGEKDSSSTAIFSLPKVSTNNLSENLQKKPTHVTKRIIDTKEFVKDSHSLPVAQNSSVKLLSGFNSAKAINYSNKEKNLLVTSKSVPPENVNVSPIKKPVIKNTGQSVCPENSSKSPESAEEFFRSLEALLNVHTDQPIKIVQVASRQTNQTLPKDPVFVPDVVKNINKILRTDQSKTKTTVVRESMKDLSNLTVNKVGYKGTTKDGAKENKISSRMIIKSITKKSNLPGKDHIQAETNCVNVKGRTKQTVDKFQGTHETIIKLQTLTESMSEAHSKVQKIDALNGLGEHDLNSCNLSSSNDLSLNVKDVSDNFTKTSKLNETLQFNLVKINKVAQKPDEEINCKNHLTGISESVNRPKIKAKDLSENIPVVRNDTIKNTYINSLDETFQFIEESEQNIANLPNEISGKELSQTSVDVDEEMPFVEKSCQKLQSVTNQTVKHSQVVGKHLNDSTTAKVSIKNTYLNKLDKTSQLIQKPKPDCHNLLSKNNDTDLSQTDENMEITEEVTQENVKDLSDNFTDISKLDETWQFNSVKISKILVAQETVKEIDCKKLPTGINHSVNHPEIEDKDLSDNIPIPTNDTFRNSYLNSLEEFSHFLEESEQNVANFPSGNNGKKLSQTSVNVDGEMSFAQKSVEKICQKLQPVTNQTVKHSQVVGKNLNDSTTAKVSIKNTYLNKLDKTSQLIQKPKPNGYNLPSKNSDTDLSQTDENMEINEKIAQENVKDLRDNFTEISKLDETWQFNSVKISKILVAQETVKEIDCKKLLTGVNHSVNHPKIEDKDLSDNIPIPTNDTFRNSYLNSLEESSQFIEESEQNVANFPSENNGKELSQTSVNVDEEMPFAQKTVKKIDCQKLQPVVMEINEEVAQENVKDLSDNFTVISKLDETLQFNSVKISQVSVAQETVEETQFIEESEQNIANLHSEISGKELSQTSVYVDEEMSFAQKTVKKIDCKKLQPVTNETVKHSQNVAKNLSNPTVIKVSVKNTSINKMDKTSQLIEEPKPADLSQTDKKMEINEEVVQETVQDFETVNQAEAKDLSDHFTVIVNDALKINEVSVAQETVKEVNCKNLLPGINESVKYPEIKPKDLSDNTPVVTNKTIKNTFINSLEESSQFIEESEQNSANLSENTDKDVPESTVKINEKVLFTQEAVKKKIDYSQVDAKDLSDTENICLNKLDKTSQLNEEPEQDDHNLPNKNTNTDLSQTDEEVQDCKRRETVNQAEAKDLRDNFTVVTNDAVKINETLVAQETVKEINCKNLLPGINKFVNHPDIKAKDLSDNIPVLTSDTFKNTHINSLEETPVKINEEVLFTQKAVEKEINHAQVNAKDLSDTTVEKFSVKNTSLNKMDKTSELTEEPKPVGHNLPSKDSDTVLSQIDEKVTFAQETEKETNYQKLKPVINETFDHIPIEAKELSDSVNADETSMMHEHIKLDKILLPDETNKVNETVNDCQSLSETSLNKNTVSSQVEATITERVVIQDNDTDKETYILTLSKPYKDYRAFDLSNSQSDLEQNLPNQSVMKLSDQTSIAEKTEVNKNTTKLPELNISYNKEESIFQIVLANIPRTNYKYSETVKTTGETEGISTKLDSAAKDETSPYVIDYKTSAASTSQNYPNLKRKHTLSECESTKKVKTNDPEPVMEKLANTSISNYAFETFAEKVIKHCCKYSADVSGHTYGSWRKTIEDNQSIVQLKPSPEELEKSEAASSKVVHSCISYWPSIRKHVIMMKNYEEVKEMDNSIFEDAMEETTLEPSSTIADTPKSERIKELHRTELFGERRLIQRSRQSFENTQRRRKARRSTYANKKEWKKQRLAKIRSLRSYVRQSQIPNKRVLRSRKYVNMSEVSSEDDTETTSKESPFNEKQMDVCLEPANGEESPRSPYFLRTRSAGNSAENTKRVG